MKIIKLFLLLSLGLLAEFRLDIPNIVNTEQLQSIVENGWSDKNKTMNDFIITNVERSMPEILRKINKPILKVKPSEQDPFPIPKILLNRDDNLLIISYCKYLEYIGHNNKALELYIKSLEGLNNIESKSMLSSIYRLVIEEMLVLGLENNLNNNTNKKIYIKEKLQKNLILDTNILWWALEDARLDTINILKHDETITVEILNKVDSFYRNYNKEVYAIKNKEELVVFKEKINSMNNQVLTAYNDWTTKNIIPNTDYDTLISSYIFIKSLPKFWIIEDLWQAVERNKKLLASLD